MAAVAAVDRDRQVWATREMMIRAARREFHRFGPFIVRDDKGDPIRYHQVHLWWIAHTRYAWARGMHAGIFAPFGHGKCQPGSARIQLADGSVATLGQLNGLTVNVLAYSADGKYVPAWGRCFDNGVRSVRRFVLRSGREVDVTAEHPFLTVSGFVEAKDVEVGRFVAVANALPEMGWRRMRPGEAALLGYFVGDGSLTCSNASVTNGDPGVVADVIACGERMGFSSSIRQSGYRVPAVAFSDGVRPWVRSHALEGLGSWDKVTPAAIFTAPLDDVAAYLGAYFACDGHVGTEKNPRGAVEYYSVNRQLLVDAQSLLARFGIVSRLARKLGKYQGQDHLSWRLRISSKHVALFAERIPVAGKKGGALLVQRKKGRMGNGDVVPLEYRALLEKTAHWHRKNTGVVLDQGGHGTRWRQRGTERETVRAAALAEGNLSLLRATAPEVFWDEVVEIRDFGELQTYGLDVDDHHTYVSDGVVVHNTSAFSVPLVSYLVGRNVQERIKIICAGDTPAALRMQNAQHIMETPLYNRVFPDVVRGHKWTDHMMFVERAGHAIDPSIEARGVETMGMGGRADTLIFDDVVDDKNSTTEEKRNRVTWLVEMKWMSRLEPGGKALWIATPWDGDDASYKMRARPDFCWLEQRAKEDLSGYEQDAHNVGSDYLEECSADVEAMLADP